MNSGGGHKPWGVVWEFLCMRTCSALVFLGGWSEGFIRFLEMVQNHCSLCSQRHNYTWGHLWMALWLTTTGTATCFLESSYNSLSKVSFLLSLVEMGGGAGDSDIFPYCAPATFVFHLVPSIEGAPLCSPWCIVCHLGCKDLLVYSPRIRLCHTAVTET